MSKTYKLTVIGDIMCEPPLLAQVKNGESYDFLPVFKPMEKLFSEADYVVGNLETPLGGKELGYTSTYVSFNTPDAIAEALKKVGMDFVSTSNNHTLDRGMEGMRRTLDALDRIGLAHTGSVKDESDRNRIGYFTVGDVKIAVIAATYATNEKAKDENGNPFEEHCIERLRPCLGAVSQVPVYSRLTKTKEFIQNVCGHKVTWEEGIELKKALELPVAYPDDNLVYEEYEQKFADIAAELAEAKKNADLVIFLPHVGGQFNTKPGRVSEYVLHRAATMGFDAIYAAHSHTTQCFTNRMGVPCFNSLGNVTMWPESFYSVRETLPEYGLAAHAYLQGKKIVKTTFSIFKIHLDAQKKLSVVPCDELFAQLKTDAEKQKLAAEVGEIYTRVTGKQPPETILREYDV